MSLNIACAGVAGGIAGIVGNPAEVVLVRMCADGAKPPAERFAYSNAVEGLARVSKEEGLATFSKGISANMARSILMSMSSHKYPGLGTKAADSVSQMFHRSRRKT